jgi:hypothetical protein
VTKTAVTTIRSLREFLFLRVHQCDQSEDSERTAVEALGKNSVPRSDSILLTGPNIFISQFVPDCPHQ